MYIYAVPNVVVFWQDQVAKDKVMQSLSTMSSAQIISATAFQNKMALQSLSRPAYPTAAGVSAPEHFTSLMIGLSAKRLCSGKKANPHFMPLFL